MKAADVVVCRAGATTLAELAASGTPAILVPLPTAADDHQSKNAEVFAKAGAAVVIAQRDLNAVLPDVVKAVVSDVEARRRMSEAARTLARPDAAARIADQLEQLVPRRRSEQAGRDAR